ncbi:MAG: exo-alpha-sialidase [Lysobacter sp.]|nr:exo-alpha-sialidase [Lysobacter sp.]
MRTPFRPLVFVALALLAACSGESEVPQPVVTGDLTIEAWPLPAMPGSAQPDLAMAPDGRVLLSWINSGGGRRPALQIAEFYPDQHWEGPRTVAVGNSMFTNWADTPHIVATADHALWTHWLQKSADAPYAYDVMLVRSLDHGMNWSAQRTVHDDGTKTEHGFVSMWAQGEGSLGIAWLDGRNTGAAAASDHASHDDGHAGAMSLRAAVFDANLRASAETETEIDAMTCDCCQTDVAATADGAVLVYRDRSAQEIRDIYATRFDGKAWSKPARVHADDWNMPACPVNGPSVAARGNDVAVAWYTAAGDKPAVKLARSVDGGATFADPVALDTGAAAQGRVAVAIDAQQVWILWLREEAGAQSLWLARYAPDLSKELQRIKLADLQGKGRATGFPKLLLNGTAAHVVWTDVVDGVPQLRGVRMRGVSAGTSG